LAKVSGEGEQQSLDLLPLPTTYYAEESAIGRIFRATQNDRPRRIGAVGLGTGTIGSYARKGDLFRFYEINPKVVEIAQETFSFLSIIKESEGDYEVVMGDARLSLESETAQNYDIITVDAFSGDSIPVHLLTREAATIYLKHLHPDGYIAFHISNRYVDLMPVVYDIARQNGLELVSYQNKADFQTGTYQSEWVVLRRPGNNQVIPEFNFYPTSMLKGKATVWTDDRSSLFEIMKW
jgi:spermidine synthase